MAKKKNVVRLRKGEVPHLTTQPGSENVTFPVIYEISQIFEKILCRRKC